MSGTNGPRFSTLTRGLNDQTAQLFIRFFLERFPQHIVVVVGEMSDDFYVRDPGYAATWVSRFSGGDYSEWYHADGESRAILKRLAPGIYPPAGERRS